jgi:type I restriction enzyme R subunit
MLRPQTLILIFLLIKDLDRQTREEFDPFFEGCVEKTPTPKPSVRRLLSDDCAEKVIVTTGQKVGLALGKNNKRNYLKRQ